MSQDMQAFVKRLKKIDKAQNGGMFSAKRRRMKWDAAQSQKPERFPVFHLLLFFALTYLALTGAKVLLQRELGERGYTAHIAELKEGDNSAKIAAKLLARDRFMAYVNGKI